MKRSKIVDATSSIVDTTNVTNNDERNTLKAKPEPLKSMNGQKPIEDVFPGIVGIAARAYQATGTLESAANIVGVTDRTIDRLAAKHPMEFAAAKEGLSSDLLSHAALATKRSAELLPTEKSSLAAMTVAGIAISRALDLRGQGASPINVNILMQAINECQSWESDAASHPKVVDVPKD